MDKDDGFGGNPRAITYDSVGIEPLGMYKHVQYPKPWVGLTDEELRQCIGIGTEDSDWNVAVVQEWLRKVEAKLKAKNGG